MSGTAGEPEHTERRNDHVLRQRVNNLLGDLRQLHGHLQGIDNEEVEAAHRRFLKHAEMSWERLLEGEGIEA
jgi:hypothetical protein